MEAVERRRAREQVHCGRKQIRPHVLPLPEGLEREGPPFLGTRVVSGPATSKSGSSTVHLSLGRSSAGTSTGWPLSRENLRRYRVLTTSWCSCSPLSGTSTSARTG